MTFKEFLGGLKPRNDARGDFVRLAKGDPAFPELTTWDELSVYIEQRRGFDAVAAGRSVWDDYGAMLRDDARRAKRR